MYIYIYVYISDLQALNGQCIYNGCCTLRVDFSKLPGLNVRFNNDKSRDYTNPLLPSGDGQVTSPYEQGIAAAAAASKLVFVARILRIGARSGAEAYYDQMTYSSETRNQHVMCPVRRCRSGRSLGRHGPGLCTYAHLCHRRAPRRYDELGF